MLQRRELCLIRHQKPDGTEPFCAPGGLVHEGESTIDALARALAEEQARTSSPSRSRRSCATFRTSSPRGPAGPACSTGSTWCTSSGFR
ncbi:NUDIX hydrolase [Kitasatospora sp. NPDC051853]|uniref:NUDIX hydrolase n=1 Tax=Kitasatospora sp. NPDC051853 TaxID=3364058 RepID=UPI0037A5FE39